MNGIEVVSQDTTKTNSSPTKAESKPAAEETKLSAETKDDDSGSSEDESDEQDATVPEESESEADGESESDEADKSEESRETKPKKKSGYQKKIEKLTRRLHEQEREMQRLMEEKSPSKEASGQAQKQNESLDGEPAPDQFETHAAYVKALAKFEAKQLFAERDKETKAKELKQSTEKQLQDYQSRADAFAEKAEDFWDVMDDVKKIPMSLVLQEEILEHANGPELLYELAKDPDEFARIAAMPAKAVLKELWKLEAKLSDKSANKPQPKTTKAPTPITPVGKKASGSVKPLHELDPDEYMKVRRMQEAKARKG